MGHDREYWRRHVEAWRASGLTQKEYAGRHRIVRGTLGWWSSRLNREGERGSGLVEVAGPRIKTKAVESVAPPPIEVVVEGRYLMRLWAGTDRTHMNEVLSVLESRR